MNHKLESSVVFQEQLRLLRSQTPFMLITTSVVGSIVVFALWNHADQIQLSTWLSAIYLISIIRFIDWYFFWKPSVDSVRLNSRSNLLVVFSAASGFVWGLVGFHFLSADNIFSALLISMTLPAMVAGSTASLSVLLPAYYAFAIPTLSLISYRLLTFDDRVFTSAGVLAILFLIANLIFARTINRSIVDSIKLRFENLELIDKYKLEKQGAELAREKSEHANVSKSKFLAAASHDLRQPLHALMLNATILNERNNDNYDEPVINNIINSVHALEGLFNSLLDISKLDAGVVTPNLVHFKLQTILDRIKVDCQSLADEKDIELDFPVSDLHVYSDPVLVERILRNIISNGIRYTNRGYVSLYLEPGSDTVNLKIVDTGVGIKSEYVDTIFEEFTQLDNPERDRSKGLGLGLSIVKRMCELLGSTIHMESSPGKGSLFYFSVPIGDFELVSDQSDSFIEYNFDQRNHFVVVIDDEESIRDGLKVLLESWNCTVLSFGSEEEAILELIEFEYPPDVLLVDYRLRKNKTGIEAISSINKLFGENIPALIITGDTASDRLKEAEDGGYKLLHKPVHPSQLRMFLQSISNN